ncbi:cysteine desulfurase family protein [Mesorhizobium sp. J428]|uniref:cysteine desulfurase family protein n=1 Tax=Mesorhizobium sp. J428 TaxID=2898440 RepID=UPI002151251B|nr:cysteine desulfurase family protein [Mesorhizobium sp. J428]MCR5859378.1 cysteine desulfurase [Mesorhizobium sp. J428]
MAARRSYLDHNASAPLSDAARAAMVGALEIDANPSSVHSQGREARRLVEAARRDVAALVGADPANVVFTSGATEGASWLLTPNWRMGRAPLHVSRLIVCAADHPATLNGGRFAQEAVTRIGVDADGILRLDELASELERHDRAAGQVMVAIHLANNETGVVQPVAQIAAIVRAAGGILVLDAVQAAGRIRLDISDGCADFLILSSHKIGGPKGAGAVVSAGGVLMPEPLIRGGGQEHGHRAGTENVAAIAGFGAATREAAALLPEMDQVAALRDRFEAEILAHVPDAVIFGRAAPRLPNTTFFAIPGLKAETAQIAFDLEGVALSAGSACSSGKVGPSHVLAAMGQGAYGGALRVSIGRGTTQEDLVLFAQALRKLAARKAVKAA